ncbi:MAG TPA: Fic family protein [Candidatus Thiothrix moscowensis]|uniref:Fic family protein n=1 Tax=unclassified Thiothrix TaxID=2636184 RepID=UPI0025E0DA0A|nr:MULTISPECIES: Fic family protein [unclassified Thiothrix]HRJ52819.1 Fic family protein [Candidatus Thiothrix moscowensis]HRJ94412.1 Fic family protein [Candidatus Thiothrix moscowensis]
MINTGDKKVRQQLIGFWQTFFAEPAPFAGHLVSASCFFGKLLAGEDSSRLLTECDVRHLYPFHSNFPYQSTSGLKQANCYSPHEARQRDYFLSARFHGLRQQITLDYRGSFIDQLRCIHFLGMAGNESALLYPSQHRRLQDEGVECIAGELRQIQTGFGDYRFNAPTPANLRPLMMVYARKVEALLEQVDNDSVHYLVSFAQYYFALLHPFYERCGRTSEELMYLLFEQLGFGWRYISATGDRSSPLARERMEMINHCVEAFNRTITAHFALSTSDIHKTPDIYRALVAAYFSHQYARIYRTEGKRPFYYTHPIPEVITAYHFLMEALLLDEIAGFDLANPPPPIKQLGLHLRESCETCYQGDILPPNQLGNLQMVLANMTSR